MHIYALVLIPTNYNDVEAEVAARIARYDDRLAIAPNPDKSIGNYVNPDGHWDWWQIGGRWTGHLSADYDPTKDEKNREPCRKCHGVTDVASCEVCEGQGDRPKNPTQWRRYGGDVATPATVIASGAYYPHDIVTQDGLWHSVGKLPKSDWKARAVELLESHEGLCVVVDYHN